MRSVPSDKTFGGGAADQLSNRGALGERAKATISSGAVSVEAPFRVQGFALKKDAVAITDETGKSIVADEVIVATGFRPISRCSAKSGSIFIPGLNARASLAR